MAWGFPVQKGSFRNHVFRLESHNVDFNVTPTMEIYFLAETREYNY